ncbi:MAG: 6-phosphogluconolactonase, partial [Ilumatobacter sp.]|uniref:6-phosphogluconolactonase n=1 Tax=Ilumatobacter sp. TaxID=1967498 RepID=UPI00329A13E1
MRIHVSPDPARACARFIGARLSIAVAERGTASLAVSGGSTAPPLFDALVDCGLPAGDWSAVDVWQVDERVAPDGDDDRNAGQLGALPATTHPMPVTADDLDAAAVRYADELPAVFDVVHLGLGSDGHTASWAPRPHPDVEETLTSSAHVLAIGEFNGRRRMTLGPAVVNAALWRVVLATGESKAGPVSSWVRGVAEAGGARVDPDLPIASVRLDDTVVFLDEAAAEDLDPSDFVRVDADGFPADVAV